MVVKSRVLELTHVKVFVLDEADNMLESGTMGEQSIQVKKCVCSFLLVLVHHADHLAVAALSPSLHKILRSSSSRPLLPTRSATLPLASHQAPTRFA